MIELVRPSHIGPPNKFFLLVLFLLSWPACLSGLLLDLSNPAVLHYVPAGSSNHSS